jgi:hypothetical protein
MTNASTLALLGGTPLRRRPFPVWPCFEKDEQHAVLRVLESGNVNYWTGDQGKCFEDEFASYLGVNYCLALANGSLALDLALRVLGIGPGDEVIVPCRSFIATASCVVLTGARPIFADVNRESQNVTVETIESVLTDRTKAIIVVHLAGMPVDLDPIMELARQRRIWVVEDCAQGHGSAYLQKNETKWSRIGTIGDIGCYSFCQDKIMTTGGEGGMLVTQNKELWSKAWSFRDHGKVFDTVFYAQHRPGFRWLHHGFGTNLRMTEMQAAIGRLQLKKLDKWVQNRRAHAALLNKRIAQIDILRTVVPKDQFFHSYYKYYCFVRRERMRPDWNRDKIMQAINAEGIPCFTGICPEIYLEKAFQALDCGPTQRLPNARELGETSLMLLVHPTLTEEDIKDMARALEKVVLQSM